MPAQTANSAEKVRQAQEARRKAALRSAARRGGRSQARQSAASEPSTASAGLFASAPAMEEQQAEVTPPVVTIETAPQVEESASDDASLDSLCEIVEANPSALGRDANSVRALCRNRRQALATRGKAAAPGKRKSSGRSSRSASMAAFMGGDANGREMARQHRLEMARKGRGNEPAARPSGRVRPKAAPPKVETGTTLAGGSVTGTQVERTVSVTGNESGTCRSITGTEYIGTEQFTTFCGTKPEANAPKVGVSTTSSGMPVSGTEVGRSAKVTGDEQGSCSSVTGTEYIGSEKFGEFCGNKGATTAPRKVMPSVTERKGLLVTGADEARVNGTTGTEAGASRVITGSQYSDTGATAKLTINGPAKVALTHTIAGQSVTGTEVGRSSRVTGDEQGSCRSVTGTEYLSNEQFSSVCGTAPAPSPAKVGVDQSQRGQRITGNLVDRTDKVTGNEPGSCKHVTGSQYGASKLCGGAPEKAPLTHTFAGQAVTGNRVDHSPKLSGGEHGGCLPVTGTEYHGREQYTEYCASTPPAASPAKVGVEQTPHGQQVSGTMVNHAGYVTGNEIGHLLPVSGTPYAGQAVETHGACCSSCAAQQAAEAAAYAAAHTGANVHAAQAAVAQGYQPNTVQDFSVVTPARYAQVSGTGYRGTQSITGPSNLGNQLVSGTPEFRHPHMQPSQHVMPAAQVPQHVMMAEPVAPAPEPAYRVTGEGRDDGIGITGDNWARGNQITGTEGRWAQGRNPTLRGEPRGMLSNAHANKELERPEAGPAAMVTGSSGSCDHGAVVTVSGGARG